MPGDLVQFLILFEVVGASDCDWKRIHPSLFALGLTFARQMASWVLLGIYVCPT
jgi:hypothetical protein